MSFSLSCDSLTPHGASAWLHKQTVHNNRTHLLLLVLLFYPYPFQLGSFIQTSWKAMQIGCIDLICQIELQIECHAAGRLSAAASLQKLPLWLVQTPKWISERMLWISAWPGYLSDRVTGLVGALQHDFIVPVTTKEDESLDARDMQRWGLHLGVKTHQFVQQRTTVPTRTTHLCLLHPHVSVKRETALQEHCFGIKLSFRALVCLWPAQCTFIVSSKKATHLHLSFWKETGSSFWVQEMR